MSKKPVPARAATDEAKTEPAVPATTSGSSTALVEAGALDFLAGAPSGLENVGTQDIVIPRLTILQALSPQLQRSKPEYNELARPGDFYDTATGEILGELTVLPCFFARVYLEWSKDRNAGLVNNYGTDASILNDCTRDADGRMTLRNGNYIAETATWFVLNLSAAERKSFIPMSSTGLKGSRLWMTLITAEKLKRSDGTLFTPPIYYRSWRMKPVVQSNAKGEWFVWRAEPSKTVLELDPTKGLLQRAIEFNKQASEGLIRGDLEASAAEHGEENGPTSAM